MARMLHLISAVGACALVLGGCGKLTHKKPLAPAYFQSVATQIEYPDVKAAPPPDITFTQAPRSVRNMENPPHWDLPLKEAIQIALANSEVIRDLGGSIINSPTTARTVLDVALQESDPLRGAEAALTAFDAQFATSVFHGRSEQAFNNIFIGGGANLLRTNASGLNAEINKRAATGTQFSMRNITEYTNNTSLANLFSSTYTTNFEAEVRHPLAQGAGIGFNRIAGPSATAGNYNGVLIARINTDVSVADFEAAVRNLVGDVEIAYWELYFAFRNFEARKKQLDATLDTWRYVHKRFIVGREALQNESLAREAYYVALEQAQDALSGVANNPTGGVYASERRLRFLLGLTATDERLIRPADEPAKVDIRFDWTDSLMQALVRRVELRRQKWQIKRRELELIAARNFRRMRLDFTGRYRFIGFGDDLFGNDRTLANSAFESLFTDGLDQWQIGLELQTPVGNRIAHTAVRNAELQLARESAVYQNLELKISHDLSAAFVEVDRAYAVSRSRYNRAISSHTNEYLLRTRYETGVDPIQFYLEALGRASEADSSYYRALVDYNLAITNVKFERGTLLEYRNVRLAEGPWLPYAYDSAAKQSQRFRPALINYVKECPPPVSLGPIVPAELSAEPLPPGEPLPADQSVRDDQISSETGEEGPLQRLPAPEPEMVTEPSPSDLP